MNPCPVKWLTTFEMASRLHIHAKTLLRLRAALFSPFREGVHYRRGGLTTKAPFQWHGDLSEKAFTDFNRVDPATVEAFSSEDILQEIHHSSVNQALAGAEVLS